MQHRPSTLADQGNVKRRRHAGFTESFSQAEITGVPVVPAGGYDRWVYLWLSLHVFHIRLWWAGACSRWLPGINRLLTLSGGLLYRSKIQPGYQQGLLFFIRPRAKCARTNGSSIGIILHIAHDPEAQTQQEIKRDGAVRKFQLRLHAGDFEKKHKAEKQP
jgi:hypothetical protein